MITKMEQKDNWIKEKKNIRLVILKFNYKPLPFTWERILVLDGTYFEESPYLIRHVSNCKPKKSLENTTAF